MNKFTCAICGTEHIGDIPDSWFTRGEPTNEIHYCSKVCLEVKLLDSENALFESKFFESPEWQEAIREALADIGENLDDMD